MMDTTQNVWCFFALEKLWFFCKIIVHHDFARKFCSRGKAGKNVPFAQNYDAFKVKKVLEKKIQVYDDKKKVEFFSTKSLQNLFLGLPIHSHTFFKICACK